MKQRAHQKALLKILFSLGIFVAATTTAQDHQHPNDQDSAEHLPHSAAAVPVYTNLGSHARTITTASPQAQVYFNQGLRLILRRSY